MDHDLLFASCQKYTSRIKEKRQLPAEHAIAWKCRLQDIAGMRKARSALETRCRSSRQIKLLRRDRGGWIDVELAVPYPAGKKRQMDGRQVRIAQAGLEIKRPMMNRTNDTAVGQSPTSERAALMRAIVGDGIETPVVIAEGKPSSTNLDGGHGTGGQIGDLYRIKPSRHKRSGSQSKTQLHDAIARYIQA